MEKPADASSGLGRRRATRWTLHFRSRLTSSTSDRSAKWDVQSALLSFRWPGAANQSSQGRASLHSLDLVYRVLLGFQREPYRVFTGLYRVLPSFTGFYWVLRRDGPLPFLTGFAVKMVDNSVLEYLPIMNWIEPLVFFSVLIVHR